MAEDTKIQWTHHTFNPWVGCSKVSDGCKHCYAATLVNARPALILGPGVPRAEGGQRLPLWGDAAPRRVTSAENWRQPLRWNRAAAKAETAARAISTHGLPLSSSSHGGQWKRSAARSRT